MRLRSSDSPTMRSCCRAKIAICLANGTRAARDLDSRLRVLDTSRHHSSSSCAERAWNKQRLSLAFVSPSTTSSSVFRRPNICFSTHHWGTKNNHKCILQNQKRNRHRRCSKVERMCVGISAVIFLDVIATEIKNSESESTPHKFTQTHAAATTS